MTPEQFHDLRTQVEDIFAALYLVDVGSLNAQQRGQHQEALSASYLALIRLENACFEQLTSQVCATLEPLVHSTRALQQQLAGLKQAQKTLELVQTGLKGLTTIANLLV